MKLIGKILITAEIVTKTGLHIGGSKTAMEIGGVDMNVIKTSQGVPYIPGSSLKGKLRYLLAKIEGKGTPDKDSIAIRRLFGNPAVPSNHAHPQGLAFEVTRLKVRDSYAKLRENSAKYFGDIFDNADLELGLTEVKWENTIKRLTGVAMPRQIEKVPENVIFHLEMVYDIYDDNKMDDDLKKILEAMRLLQDDYLGGQGSRGYGKVKIEDLKFHQKNISDYNISVNGGELLNQYTL